MISKSQIHNLSYSLQCSVNTYINLNYDFLKYASIEDILTKIVKTDHNCTIMKQNIKETFHNILIASQAQ